MTVYNNTMNVHQFWNGVCWVNVGQTVCSFDYALSLSHPSDCLLKTNFAAVSDTITAVSYTHLDVYKRQVGLDTIGLGFGVLPLCFAGWLFCVCEKP